MDTGRIDSLLSQLRSAAAYARNGPMGAARTTAAASAAAGAAAGANGKPDFGAVLKTSLEQVNAQQQQATRLATAFELGSPNVQLHDVMISMSKANVSFQQTVQVRNRLVSAYHDIMNMQV